MQSAAVLQKTFGKRRWLFQASAQFMKHRQLILSSLLLIGVLVAISKFSPRKPVENAILPPIELRSDGAVNPLAASPQPLLNWQVSSPKRGEKPTAWQVRVSSSEDQLAKDSADLWDSGKVGAVDLPGLRYGGEALKAGSRAHWQVRWWGEGENPSPWSEIATFEVAPNQVADWQGARWMDDGKPVPTKMRIFTNPIPRR